MDAEFEAGGPGERHAPGKAKPTTSPTCTGPEASLKRAQEHYSTIASYENHFNNMEAEIRKLASVWLLAALGAIAYLVRQEVIAPLVDVKLLIAVIGLMGNLGLVVLWILDQLVYHRLLNAVFLLGVRMEYVHRHLPPIRTLMMLFSRKRGMARYLRLFYVVPMCVLGGVAMIAGVWSALAGVAAPQLTQASVISALVGAVAILIPVWVAWRSANLESYAEIAEGFGDADFKQFLENEEYEELLRGH